VATLAVLLPKKKVVRKTFYQLTDGLRKKFAKTFIALAILDRQAGILSKLWSAFMPRS